MQKASNQSNKNRSKNKNKNKSQKKTKKKQQEKYPPTNRNLKETTTHKIQQIYRKQSDEPASLILSFIERKTCGNKKRKREHTQCMRVSKSDTDT